MKVLAIAILAIVLLAGIAQAEFVLPPVSLEAVNLHSLVNGENVTCGALSTQVASVKGVPLELSILFSSDFQAVGKWGIGLSAAIFGPNARLKLGLGTMPDMKGPLATLSFRLL